MEAHFNSVTVTMKRMWIFIKVESSMTWLLMRLASGQSLCLGSFWVLTDHLRLGYFLGPSLQEIRAVLDMDGSKEYLLSDDSMNENAIRIITLYKLWWMTTKLLWKMTLTMSTD